MIRKGVVRMSYPIVMERKRGVVQFPLLFDEKKRKGSMTYLLLADKERKGRNEPMKRG